VLGPDHPNTLLTRHLLALVQSTRQARRDALLELLPSAPDSSVLTSLATTIPPTGLDDRDWCAVDAVLTSPLPAHALAHVARRATQADVGHLVALSDRGGDAVVAQLMIMVLTAIGLGPWSRDEFGRWASMWLKELPEVAPVAVGRTVLDAVRREAAGDATARAALAPELRDLVAPVEFEESPLVRAAR